MADETIAATPLNLTEFALGVAPKLLPWMTTVLPTTPLVVDKLVIAGGGMVTVKLDKLVPRTPPDLTRMGPVTASTDTVANNLVAETYVTERAAIPPKVTVASDANPFPSILIEAPTAPEVGTKPVTAIAWTVWLRTNWQINPNTPIAAKRSAL